MKMSASLNNTTLELADQVGDFIEYWGFKQVHGKVWTVSYLSPDPVDAKFLQETLNISKALVSMTLKDLLDYKVLLEVEKDKPGSQKYLTNPDILSIVLSVLKNREARMLSRVRKTQAKLEKSAAKAKVNPFHMERLENIGYMVSAADEFLGAFLLAKKVDEKPIYEAFSPKS